MIKINLVPLKEKKKQQEYIFILAGVVIAVILASGMYWVYIQKIQTKRDLNVQIKKVEDESKSYEEKIAEVNAFEETQKRLDAANKNIKDIQTVQKKVVFVLDKLASNLPSGVWITSVAQGANKDAGSFVVDGCAFSLSNVNEYFDALIKTEGLSKGATLEIRNMIATVGNNKQIIQFEIITKPVDASS
jgi:type IV pilus assembly protein PilN